MQIKLWHAGMKQSCDAQKTRLCSKYFFDFGNHYLLLLWLQDSNKEHFDIDKKDSSGY